MVSHELLSKSCQAVKTVAVFAKLEGSGLYLVEHELSIRADSDAFRFLWHFGNVLW